MSSKYNYFSFHFKSVFKINDTTNVIQFYDSKIITVNMFVNFISEIKKWKYMNEYTQTLMVDFNNITGKMNVPFIPLHPHRHHHPPKVTL